LMIPSLSAAVETGYQFVRDDAARYCSGPGRSLPCLAFLS
jgi:hypothetical protein